MITLGIDPGTATTGFGIIREEQDGSLTVLDYGVIETDAGLPQADRLVQLYKRIRELIFLHRPEMGAVEKLFLERNVRTALSVGQARGVTCWQWPNQNYRLGNIHRWK